MKPWTTRSDWPKHVYREDNTLADREANRALEGVSDTVASMGSESGRCRHILGTV